jgi:alkanesulfonate monooxygenase SsuD/methylene tetrahydromethanopterin reductase-like flavin-dependent oxidoreductase (luciferase family)
MKIGVTLPQFTDRSDLVVAAAQESERLGLDGVFCFDHLWPIGQPDRPALVWAPLLGAVAASTSTIAVGSFVARIGLQPDAMLAGALISLSTISGGRFIAGLGTGDRLSRAENEAFGIPFESADERRGHLAVVATAVQAAGVPVWVGGGQHATVELTRALGATVAVWASEPAQVAELVSTGLDVAWGGPVGTGVTEAGDQLANLADAGAAWAVCAWPESLEAIAAAAAMLRSRQ